jgi:DNA helicase II / ATP-dependent DNA helicase PcrA
MRVIPLRRRYNHEMDVSHLLDSLNEDQRRAVGAKPGHYLVLAGAGSGKTRVLTNRIAWLCEVDNVWPHAVLAVTFTNKAAGEMRSRTEGLLTRPSRGMWVGTFHGIAHRLLRAHYQEARLPESFQILDSDDQQRLIKRTIQGLELDDSKFQPRHGQWMINAWKDEGKRPAHIDPGHNLIEKQWLRVYEAYEAACQRAGVVDFAELLLRSHELWLTQPALLEHYQRRFSHILVDEFQDTNTVQYAWIRVLAGESAQVFVVGDDDQSIYSWRGARVENMRRFINDFPGAQTIRLEQNYRSTSTILEAANAVIANNGERMGKKLWTDTGKGESIQVYAAYNEQDEARFVIERIKQAVELDRKASECAILYRSNAQSRLFEEALIQNAIPYRVYGGLRFFERAEIKDALAYVRMAANPADDVAFERAVNMPPRGVGDRSLDAIRTYARNARTSLHASAGAMLAAGDLSGRGKTGVGQFLQLVAALTDKASSNNLAELMESALDQSGLLAHYASDKDETAARRENLEQLLEVARNFNFDPETAEGGTELSTFLAQAALEAGENQAAAYEDCVQLMTLHSAKGLEFPLVFLVGLEDGLFPTQRAIDDTSGNLEEERRLAYVGITRARQLLTLCYAESRRMHGQETFNRPSRFINEIPKDLLREVRPRVNVSRPTAFGRIHDDNTPKIKLGARVKHATYGEGILLGMEGSGDHTVVQVNFAGVGAKRLIWALANLQVM